MKKLLTASFLSAVFSVASVSADELITGNFGRMMMGGSAWSVVWLLHSALFIGVLLLVWLGVIKLWRELFRKKK